MLELRNVSARYGTQTVLHRLSLSIEPGRTTVLIGPSGCGKSTLLRLMIGLLQPHTGAVLLDGVKVGGKAILETRRRMGYVIQDGGLFPHLMAEQNVCLMARYLGWDRRRIGERLQELVTLTHLSPEFLGRYPGQLSGGQQQRVSLMRALMLDPDVLLLDEPLGALDPMIRADLQADLKAIFRTLNKTVVLVTHDLGEAAYFGDTIVLLRDGHVVQSGSLEELMHEPAAPFVTEFINAQRSPLDAMAEEGVGGEW